MGALPARTRDLLADEFVRYLVHRQSFHATLRNCAVLAGDAPVLRRALKQRLTVLIDDPWWSTTYRPCLLRLATGDAGLAVRLGVDVDDLRRTIMRSRMHVRHAVAACRHRVDMLGPDHAQAVARGVLQRTDAHAGKFSQRRARFLTMGENGLQLHDIRTDLLLFALRCIRWYYPFRAGLHLDNTVRNTITNRGLSYVKHHTRQCRARMVQDANGTTTNMECHDELAVERYCSQGDEQSLIALRTTLAQLAGSPNLAVSRIARFVLDERLQDAFLEFVHDQYPHTAGIDGMMDAVRASGQPYWWLVRNYLNLDRRAAIDGFREIRAMVA